MKLGNFNPWFVRALYAFLSLPLLYRKEAAKLIGDVGGMLCGNVAQPEHLNPFTADPVKALTLPYQFNPPFLIFDIRALWRSVLSARAPECQKLKIVA